MQNNLNKEIYGNYDIRNIINGLLSNNHLHHAMLFSGPKGVGKYTYALNLAKKIIGNEDLILNGTHPDLMIISPIFDEKKQKHAKEITIDQVREISNFIHLSASFSKNKLIIIDSIDQMNNNSMNAILKYVEEPPKNTYFILIHHLGRILPTIKSRCSINKFSALSFQEMSELMDISMEEYKICQGSMGRAVLLKNYGGFEIFNEMLDLTNHKKINDFAIKYSKVDTEIWDIIEYLFFHLITSSIKYKELGKESYINSDNLFEIYDLAKTLFANIRTLNADKKTSLITLFSKL